MCIGRKRGGHGQQGGHQVRPLLSLSSARRRAAQNARHLNRPSAASPVEGFGYAASGRSLAGASAGSVPGAASKEDFSAAAAVAIYFSATSCSKRAIQNRSFSVFSSRRTSTRVMLRDLVARRAGPARRISVRPLLSLSTSRRPAAQNAHVDPDRESGGSGFCRWPSSRLTGPANPDDSARNRPGWSSTGGFAPA